MSQTHEDAVKFEGEDASSGYASPLLDLIAATFLILLSIIIMAASVALPMPGDLVTAPGLLPFITSGSLLVMALVLGYTAVKRRRAGVTGHTDAIELSEYGRAFVLAVIIAVYIAALQFLAFQSYLNLGGFSFTLSAFEPTTIIALATLIHISWRGPIWITILTSVIWTMLLSVVFQKVFSIPLPGGF